MIKYIIDSHILLAYPGILAKLDGNRIIIPRAVIKELSFKNKDNSANSIINLIKHANAKIAETPHDIDIPLSIQTYKLSGADLDIVKIAIDYKKRNSDDVYVITEDKVIINFLKNYNIVCLTGREFIESTKEVASDKNIEKEAKSIVFAQNNYLIKRILLGTLIAGCGFLIYSNIGYIYSKINVWGTILLIFTIGLFLYAVRERTPLAYGVTELIAGIIISANVFYPTFDYNSIHFTESLKILGGIYIIVRGLDNIGKGIKETRAERYWNKIFKKT